MRKRLYLARSFAASSGSTSAGAAGGTGAAGGMGTTEGSAIGRDEAAGGDKEAGGDTVTGEGKRTDGGAVATGGATTAEGKFERLGGVLCDPSPKTFFSRLQSPLESLTVCWRSSAIWMRVGDDKCFVCERSGLYRLS